MEPTCCTERSPTVDPGFDTPVALDAVESAVSTMVEAGLPMTLRLPCEATGWCSAPLRRPALGELLDGPVVGWVVQRPGCAGLTTRVVLVDGAGVAVAVVEPAREPRGPEPAAWPVSLLLGLARHARAA